MSAKELFKYAQKLEPYIEFDSKDVDALITAAETVGRSWSGSWLGYHSRVYYENFQVPPPGALFSQEWGFMDAFRMGTRGAWEECVNRPGGIRYFLAS